MTLAELNEKVENNIVPYFERASGVASVSVSGGVEEEVAIKFSQEELNLYGLTLSTVAQMLAAENINLPSGSIDRGASEVVVRTIGEFDNADDIANLPITIADRVSGAGKYNENRRQNCNRRYDIKAVRRQYGRCLR